MTKKKTQEKEKKTEKKQSILDNKGLVQFVIRSAVFFAVLFGLYFFVFVYFRHTPFFLKYLSIDERFYFDFLTGLRKRDFINAALFTVTMFVLWNRNMILKLRPYSQKWKETILFGSAAILSQIAHYSFKYWIKINPDVALSNTLLMTLIKYAFNVVFVILLALAAYNMIFFKRQFRKFKKQIPILALIMVVYFFLIQFFNNIWRFLGEFVANTTAFLLGLSFDNVYLAIDAARAPRLGVGRFIVGISEECSGIDSLLLFISLYSALLVLDWKRMHVKRMLFLLIPGIIGTVAYNILRVYLLMLVGILIDPEFAVDMFHSNIGWILFLLFFIVFWNFGSNWVYKKTSKSSEK